MTTPRSLLERLRRAPTPRGHSREQDLDDLRRSVSGNLERILNSREGMAAACATYGLPDLTRIVNGVPERVREIEESIERCIREFEPRVKHVAVTHVPDTHGPLTACFRIQASLQSGKTAEEVWFDTVVVASGRVRLT